jgi:hypothetical protein
VPLDSKCRRDKLAAYSIRHCGRSSSLNPE